MIEKISEKEINKNKISGLPVRPNDSSSFGSGKRNAAELREQFDALPLVIIKHFNDFIDSIRDGTKDGLAASIPTGINHKSLANLFADVMNASFASYLSVISERGELSSLQKELEYIYEALGDTAGGRIFGTECHVGARGYYYKSIDTVNRKIYLSYTQVLPVIGSVNNTDPNFPTPEYGVGGTLAIINNNKYFPGVKIVSVQNNVITYSGNIGFSSINAVDSAQWSADDYSLFCLESPEKGMFELKSFGLAAGFLCRVLGNSGASIGTDNTTYGDHGFTYNYGNKAAWAASAGGYGNESNGFYSDTVGRDNVNDAECGRMAGRGNRATKDAYGADVGGNGNTVEAPYSKVSGTGNKVGKFAKNSDIGGEGNEVDSEDVAVHGKKNTVKDGAQKTRACRVNGELNCVTGVQNTDVSGKQNVVDGSTVSNQWGGSQSSIGGLNNKLDGTTNGATNVHLHGEQNLALHRNADVAGKGNRSSAVNQIVRGTFCKDDPDALLIIGNGTSDTNRSNAFVVKKNGDLYALGKKLASLEYVDKKYSQLINSAPEMLDTLDELASALGNDANFSATVMKMIADNREKSVEIENWIGENITFDPSDAGKMLVISDTGKIVVKEIQNQQEDTMSLTDLIEGDITSIVIPAGTTKIKPFAFYCCFELCNVIIPNSVKAIEYNAFDSCYNLNNLIIPNGVETIGSGAFYDCAALESINIPDSVVEVEGGAFDGCSGVTMLVIGSGVKSLYGFTDMGGQHQGPPKLKYSVIGNSVEEIPAYFFNNCTNLTTVILGNKVKKIHDSAFNRCTSLSHLEIPDSLQECENSFGETKLNFIVENGVRYFGNANNPYMICCGIETNHPSELRLNSNCKIIAPGGCSGGMYGSGITSVILPEGIVSIGSKAFMYNYNMSEITLPSTTKNIGSYCFAGGYVDKLTVLAPEPPILKGPLEFEHDMPPSFICVPAASVEAYKSDTNWAQYADIIEAK